MPQRTRTERLAAQQALAAAPETQQTLADRYVDPTSSVVEWLAQLCLLYGVPFENLVPDARMMPPESIRFFYLDHNWINALLDGAMSVGQPSHYTGQILAYLIKRAKELAKAEVPAIRRKLLNEADPSVPLHETDLDKIAIDQPVGGMLIRSELIANWPGLEILAYADFSTEANVKAVTGSNLLDLLRLERLAPDVLLCLYQGVPKLVELREPKEGLAFGGQQTKQGARQAVLRELGTQAGQPVASASSVSFPYRTATYNGQTVKNVVKISALQDTLQTDLRNDSVLSSSDSLRPGDFALQLIHLPERQQYYQSE